MLVAGRKTQLIFYNLLNSRNKIKIGRVKRTSSYDVPYFISDLNYVKKLYKWEPRRNLKKVVADLYFWMLDNNSILKKYF